MILSLREKVTLPYTSRCIIHTQGVLHDHDIISVTSPIFTSVEFSSKEINTSEAFDVEFRGTDVENNLPDGSFFGILEISDDDTFNMYVHL